MAEFRITDPATGRTIKMTGDQAPTGDQIRAAFASLPPPAQSELRPGGARGAAGEALITIGTGIVAEPVSGIAGLLATGAGFVGGLVPGGESPKEKALRFGTRTIEATQEALTFQPRTQAGAAAVEAIGGVAETGLELARIPVAGIAGLAQLPFSGIEGAAETIRRIEEEGIGETAGSAVLEATGSPALAALVSTVPTAIAAIVGVRNPFRRAATPPPPAFQFTTKGPQVSVGRPALDKPVDFTPPGQAAPVVKPLAQAAEEVTPGATLGARQEAVGVAAEAPRPSGPTPVSSDQIISDLRKGKPAAVAEAVIPDREIVEAAQRLGVDLNPEHYATNTAFQDVTRALKSKPGSELQAREVALLDEISLKADKLVEDIGGSIDKAAVSDDILLRIRQTIDELQTKANAAYKRVRETIPDNTRVDTAVIRAHLDKVLDGLGGDKTLLTTVEKKLLTLIERGEDGSITYAALDRVRRDVGDGFNKRSGPFADDSDFILREVYGVLSDSQNGVAQAFGIGELYAEARRLIVKRKGIEDNAVALFGRDMVGSLVPKIRQSATALTKGDVAPLNKLMEALPVARRAEVAATILSDLFAGGSRQGGALGTGFAANWAALNRNVVAKNALFRHLPPGAAQRFDDIGRVISGIVRANRKPLSNPSGSAGPIIQALENGTAVTKVLDAGSSVGGEIAATAVSGVPGISAAIRFAQRVRSKEPQIVKADRLINSQPFKDALKVAIEGDAAGANIIIENSPQFKAWAGTLDPNTAANIANTGFIGWLSAQDQQENR